MLVALRSFIQLLLTGRITVVQVFAAVFFLVLGAASEGLSAQANSEFAGRVAQPALVRVAPAGVAAQVPAGAASQAPCPPSANLDIPLESAIEAKVTGTLDSGHLKVGKEVWVKVVNGLVYPSCTLNTGAALFGHVTAAVSRENSNSSELSLVFDRADCEGHRKKEMPLRLIGLVGPEEMSERMHDQVPIGMKGSQRNMPAAVLATLDRDDKLNPGGAPHTVRIGVVIGLPKVKLDYKGGPGCSARISSTDRGVQLETGSELLFVVQSAP
jgi:hypothetical protein